MPALVLAELDYWCARRLTLDAWLVFLDDVDAIRLGFRGLQSGGRRSDRRLGVLGRIREIGFELLATPTLLVYRKRMSVA